MLYIQLPESVRCDNIRFKVHCAIVNEIKCECVTADADHDRPQHCENSIIQIVISDHPKKFQAGYQLVFDCSHCLQV